MPLLPRSRVGAVILALSAALIAVVVVLIASTGWLDALGAAPEGERLARIRRSPNYRDGAFRNPSATSLTADASTWKVLRQWLGGKEQRVPPGPIPIVRMTRSSLAQPPASGTGGHVTFTSDGTGSFGIAKTASRCWYPT